MKTGFWNYFSIYCLAHPASTIPCRLMPLLTHRMKGTYLELEQKSCEFACSEDNMLYLMHWCCRSSYINTNEQWMECRKGFARKAHNSPQKHFMQIQTMTAAASAAIHPYVCRTRWKRECRAFMRMQWHQTVVLWSEYRQHLVWMVNIRSFWEWLRSANCLCKRVVITPHESFSFSNGSLRLLWWPQRSALA